jgi:putative hydrolase of the HAD superfamily
VLFYGCVYSLVQLVNMIKAVIFDFFGVLVTEGFKRFCDEYFAGSKIKRRQALDLVTAHDRGKISQEEYISELANLAEVDEDTVRAHMEGNQPNKLLISYIKTTLKPKYKIGVLSNSGDNYLSQILNQRDVQLFDDIVLSYKHGFVKPQAGIYELASRRLNVKASECVFVDDSLTHCEGAIAVGMKTIHYKNFSQMKKDLEKILAAGADH